MSAQLTTTNNTRNLPTLPIREAERAGAQILAALDRLGFTHKDLDGRLFTVCFESAELWGDSWASFTVDVGRLYHFDVLALASQKVKATLAAATRKDVFILTKPGLVYAVRLQPAQPAQRLPKLAELDLDARPADPLSVPLGVGRAGPVWRSLPDLGHSLIVGTSGAGKSSWLHTALAALLTSASPDLLRLVLVDPKRSELTPWAAAPHLMGSIANTEAQAQQALDALAVECDRRGDLLAAIGARDIGGYNRRAADPLPLVLCVIDEVLDFAGNRAIEESQKTIARRGRSAGVILWAATQHAAAVDGLPRVVNVNLTTRLVFRVADGNAAQVAGCPGAQNIPQDRPGRLLAKLGSGPQELQGYYLSDDALQALARGLAGNTATGLALGDLECDLVRYAVQDLGGAFKVNTLARAFAGQGMTNRKVAELARRWERRGWLTKPAHATDSRKITPDLAALAGLTG